MEIKHLRGKCATFCSTISYFLQSDDVHQLGSRAAVYFQLLEAKYILKKDELLVIGTGPLSAICLLAFIELTIRCWIIKGQKLVFLQMLCNDTIFYLHLILWGTSFVIRISICYYYGRQEKKALTAPFITTSTSLKIILKRYLTD